ncbi:MAG: sugar phosphate nucleotidyltransferase [Gemmatimonadales bacterium]
MPATEWAVVLAAGRASRLRSADPDAALTAPQAEAADAGRKAMMPIGRPFLDFVLSSLADAGVGAVCLVVGPDHDDVASRYWGAGRPTRLRLERAVQAVPRGTADAVLAARPVVRDAPFLMVNGDNLYPVPALRALGDLPGSGVLGFRRTSLVAASNFGAERIARFALLDPDDGGRLRAVVEKPSPNRLAEAGSDPLIGMNAWRFESSIFEACGAIAPSERGELEIQEAVGFALGKLGVRFDVLEVEGGVIDLTVRSDVATAAERLAHVPVRL